MWIIKHGESVPPVSDLTTLGRLIMIVSEIWETECVFCISSLFQIYVLFISRS